MKAWIQNCINQWNSEGLELNPAASEISIIEAENNLKFKFPNDFKELYSLINGFVDFEWRENMFSLWSLERIVKEFCESDDKNIIGFCDYLIVSHIIGFDKNSKEIIKSYGSFGKEKLSVQSFEETMLLINTNSELLY